MYVIARIATQEVVLPPWSAPCCLSGQEGGAGVGGGPDHVSMMAKWASFCISNRQEMPGSSDQGRALLGLCIPRSLPRWHDPDALGVLSPATILKTPARTQKVERASLATLWAAQSRNRLGPAGGFEYLYVSYGPCSDKLLLSDVIWRARLNSSEGGLGALRKSGSESGCT